MNNGQLWLQHTSVKIEFLKQKIGLEGLFDMILQKCGPDKLNKFFMGEAKYFLRDDTVEEIAIDCGIKIPTTLTQKSFKLLKNSTKKLLQIPKIQIAYLKKFIGVENIFDDLIEFVGDDFICEIFESLTKHHNFSDKEILNAARIYQIIKGDNIFYGCEKFINKTDAILFLKKENLDEDIWSVKEFFRG